MDGILEIAKVLVEPGIKLMELVGNAIGTIYEPWHKKRMAKATAEEIRQISSAINDNINLPMVYKDGAIEINSTDANGLSQRAQSRFLFQEMKKQQNIEAVVQNAYLELEGKEKVTNEPVDEDWVCSFFDYVANIGNEEMQQLWGKILAGEIERPGSFSIRTLDILRKMTQKEAQLFAELVPYILQCYGDNTKTFYDYFVLNGSNTNGKLMSKYGFPFSKIILLNEAGLISANGMIMVRTEVPGKTRTVIRGFDRNIVIENKGFAHAEVSQGAYILTENGKELYPIVKKMCTAAPLDQYFLDCIAELKEDGFECHNIRELEMSISFV